MAKIKMTTPLVEMDGDEMTRILWQWIKDELLSPFVELNTEYYDLGLKHRNETDDKVTVDSAEATKKYGVAVKCATITPNAARMTEYDLKAMYKSPNGTIRAILDGTVFRAPIIVKGIEPLVKNWKKPITIARHAYGDVYKGVEMKIPAAGRTELVYTAEDGTQTKELIHEFDGPGIIQGMHNINASIESFDIMRRPDQAGFVGVHDMFRCTIGFRKDCDGANTHLFARTHDAYGNFSSVGNQNFLNHKILFKLKLTLNDTVRIPIQDNR